jgi:tRNA-specific 2-thiouridylase
VSRRKRVLVAMSGGVDSSTAAALLSQQGHEVIGVGLRLVSWPPEAGSENSCCGIAGMDDARRVAARLGIPFYVLDYQAVFEERVVRYFCRSYISGVTPNPCTECNRTVKFGVLQRFAESAGADYVATGHYARVSRDPSSGRYLLRKGVDAARDQSYFLCSLSQKQLSRALFPLGTMTKTETRSLAASFGLHVHARASSQDICFVDRRGYRRFLAARFPEAQAPGSIKNTRGETIGRHPGVAFHTVGQRRGLGVARGKPMYVVALEGATRTVVVGDRGELQRDGVCLSRMNWIPFEKPGGRLQAGVKIRYRHPEAQTVVSPLRADRAALSFNVPQSACAPGQLAVLYDGDLVLGGGTIEPSVPESVREC